MTSSPDMELKIIQAAIACIEKYGYQDATVRRIADEAGVNVSAINYYFRSKDHLMERVLEITLDNAFDWKDFDEFAGLPPKQRLAAILDHLTSGAQAYPEITRVHFITPIVERLTHSLSFARFNEFMEKLYDDMVSRGVRPGVELRNALTQAVSASILGVGLMADLFAGFAGQDLRDAAVRRRYIERLVDGVL